MKKKQIHVKEYVRHKNGRAEHVTDHNRLLYSPFLSGQAKTKGLIDHDTATREEWDNLIKRLHSGDKVEVSKAVYYYFLDLLPPIKMFDGGFLFREGMPPGAETLRFTHEGGKFYGQLMPSNGRATTPFRRREALAKIMRGNGTYHNMMEDEALGKFNYKTRVLFKTTSDKKHWADAELQFPTYDAAMTWAKRAEKSDYFKDIYIEEI